jgi:hypothetical protein
MDNEHFATWTRSLASRLPRRRLWPGGLKAVAGGALAVTMSRFDRLPAAAREEAAKRCLKDGDECKRGNQCCSGLCKGKKCRRAPGQGTCTIRKDRCKTGDSDASRCAGGDCLCFRRLDGAAVCAGDGECFDCSRDADCVAAFGERFVCVQGDRRCSCASTACLERCSDEERPPG